MKLDLERQRRKVTAGVLMSIALLLAGRSVLHFQTSLVVVPAEPANIANSSNPQKPKIKDKDGPGHVSRSYAQLRALKVD